MDQPNPIIAFIRETQRRGVFKLAVLYVLCAWLMMQVADVFFPAWDILQMKQEVAMPASRAVEKPPNSIAVLPFTNVTEDPSNEFFCDGISEEILHRLSDYRDTHVLARQSSFAFKGADLDVPRLSDILGVRYLLQGSERRDGDDLRISAQLVNDTGLQLWSKSYDRKLARLLLGHQRSALGMAARQPPIPELDGAGKGRD